VLTSTTLMARAAATDEAIALARANPSLGVGCHIVLVDGEPVLPPREIPTLVDSRTGCFPPKLSTFLLRLFTGRIRSSEIEAEAAAQIALLQRNALRLTHIDSHKHAHMFPAVLRPVLRAAANAGIHAVRNPFEPEWAIRATPRASLLRTGEVLMLRHLGPFFRKLIAQENASTTDGTIAVVGTGTLDADAVRSMLTQLPPGTWELVTHPGYNDADLDKVRTRLRTSREIERKALHAISEFPALDLISFQSLNPERAPSTVV
jgi:chitin disaccharide deacetylase